MIKILKKTLLSLLLLTTIAFGAGLEGNNIRATDEPNTITPPVPAIWLSLRAGITARQGSFGGLNPSTNKVSVMNGYGGGGAGAYSKKHEVLNLNNGQWESYPDLAAAYEEAGYAWYRDVSGNWKHIHMGGFGGASRTTVLRWDVTPSNSFTTLASLNTANAGGAMKDIALAWNGVLGGRIYMAGGDDGDGQGEVDWRFYIVTANSYVSMTNMPDNKKDSILEYYDGKFYNIGGISSGTTITRVDIWTVSTNAWTTGNAMPISMSGMGSEIDDDGNIIMAGGWQAGGAAYEPFFAVYDTQADSWTIYNDLETDGDEPITWMESDTFRYTHGRDSSSWTAVAWRRRLQL